MGERPIMNNVAERLARLQQSVYDLEAHIKQLRAEVSPAQETAQRLLEMQDQITELTHMLANMRTLAHPQSWRLQLCYDQAFMTEFLTCVDEKVLAAAIRDGGRPVMQRLLWAISAARNPKNAGHPR